MCRICLANIPASSKNIEKETMNLLTTSSLDINNSRDIPL